MREILAFPEYMVRLTITICTVHLTRLTWSVAKYAHLNTFKNSWKLDDHPTAFGKCLVEIRFRVEISKGNKDENRRGKNVTLLRVWRFYRSLVKLLFYFSEFEFFRISPSYANPHPRSFPHYHHHYHHFISFEVVLARLRKLCLHFTDFRRHQKTMGNLIEKSAESIGSRDCKTRKKDICWTTFAFRS